MAHGRKTPKASNSQRAGVRGLWRDGKLLVIDLTGHRFPLRCLKTNLSVEASDAKVTLGVSNPPLRELASLEQLANRTEVHGEGAHGGSELDKGHVRVIHGSRSGSHIQVTLKLPLRPRWRQVMQWRLGARLMQVGAVGLVLLLGGAAWQHFMWGHGGRGFSAWEFYLLMSSLALIGAGCLIDTVQQSLLPIREVHGGLLWLGGVHRDWLHGLPEFQPTEHMRQEVLSKANWELWTSIVLSAIFLGLIVGTLLSGVQQDRSIQIVIHGFLVFVTIALLIGNRARLRIQRAKRARSGSPTRERGSKHE